MARKNDPQLRLLFKPPSTVPTLPMPARDQLIPLLGQMLAELIRPKVPVKKEPRHESKD
jgi:hypothetical protein